MRTRRGLLFKRLLDLCGALVGLVLLMPVFLLCASAIFLTMGRPVFFRQMRPGKNAQPFELVKFRTMSHARDTSGKLLSDGMRLTAVGRFLRAASLDEIPQLWNVLRGDMSLVGPRPLLMEYVPRYNAQQARRHDMTPGITGWAQVNGRNAISWDEKFRLDVDYVENWNFGWDIRILWMTFAKVLKRKDISQQGHATMPEFMGNETQGEPRP